jgi:hypothetical protein
MGLRTAVGSMVLAICLGLSAPTHAASTTNFSDQWWVPAESGWGAAILQQEYVLFIDLFVYGSDTKPVWYTAAATFRGLMRPGTSSSPAIYM